MNISRIFLLIVILIAVGVAVFLISYPKQSSPAIQPIKLPVKEKIPAPEEGEKPEAAKIVEIKEIKDEIETKTEGEIIKYREESFYSKDDFSVILENEKEFRSQLIEGLNKRLIRVEAENFGIDFNQSKKSAILNCDIKGARYSTNSYDMHFILNGTARFGFDLYGFKEVGKKFIYEGEINGIPTKIILEFPYEFGHCHEHVWPK